MLLSDVLQGIEVLDRQGADVEITKISTRSGEENGGAVFVCLVGGTTDAHDRASEAIARGAVAVVSEKRLELPVTQIVVRDTRDALARMAATFFGHPADAMKMIAVVGTNGKTTTAHMIRAELEYAGVPCCMIGTNGFVYGDVRREYGMTTPDPVEWQAMLSEARRAGCAAAVTEVSAHAIRFRKTAGTRMDVTVFTNLSRDHLDFFGDMETYAGTKASFFAPEFTREAVVNTDDELGVEIALSAKVPTVTYGITSPSDVFAIDYRDTPDGARFVVNLQDDLYEVRLPMHGEYNMYNAIAAITAGKLLGLRLETMAEALARMPQVPGRYQTFDVNGVKVVVDYAHTPDGIAKLLDSVSEWAVGRVITVFGCGGNRDRNKRPLMARVAELRSDFIILTSDNPRYEEPEDIIEDCKAGLTEPFRTLVNVDRTAAIRYAIRMAGPGDVVAILGKGNEPYMEIRGEKRRYCDLDVVKTLMIGDQV